MAKPRVKVPETAVAGDIITIKAIISHSMESGHRQDKQGQTIARNIINSFKCEFNGAVFFSCDIHTGISANPFFEFNARVDEAGTFRFIWTDDDGVVTELEKTIALE